MTTSTWNVFKNAIAYYLQIDPSNIHQEHNISDDLGADTLDLIHIIFITENAFKISIPASLTHKFLGDMSCAIECIDSILDKNAKRENAKQM